MIPVTCMAGRKLALFGLGGSGLATALALKAGGAEILAFDDSETSLDKARAAGIVTADLRGVDWSDFDAFVLAPGVPLTHPTPHWTVGLAREAGCPIIGDIELFCRERNEIAPDAPFVAITGTNGKSTTTALVSHILAEAGRDVQMGGNIGTAILSLAPPAFDRIHVIELSSFQVDLTPSLNPTVGALLNISADHLDRHGTMENYAAIKERVVSASKITVTGVDDELSAEVALRMALAKNGYARAVSARRSVDEGVYAEGTRLFAAASGLSTEIADLAGIGFLRGAHNAQNAAAATAICLSLGLDEAAIARGLASFPGLKHRMEQVGRIGRVLFVNDSKATNADSTEKALLSFENIHWILGGKAKAGGISSLQPLFTKIDKAYLIGEASDAFAATLEGKVPAMRCGTLDIAVAEAARDAAASGAAEPVVLLSPACASYDQFPNFEIRGESFRTLVRALPGMEA